MRVLPYILIVLGIYLLVRAGYQEFRGSTTRPMMYLPFSKRSLLEHRHNNAYLFSIRVFKINNPKLFREFMETHWIYAILVEIAGVALCATQYRLPGKHPII
jgi:hypothetical protein